MFYATRRFNAALTKLELFLVIIRYCPLGRISKEYFETYVLTAIELASWLMEPGGSMRH